MLTSKPESEESNEEIVLTKSASKALPEDWEFMKQSGEVLEDIPDTWKQYPDNINGRASIVDMEYKEFQSAPDKEKKKHELMHLASACLYMWRALNSSK